MWEILAKVQEVHVHLGRVALVQGQVADASAAWTGYNYLDEMEPQIHHNLCPTDTRDPVQCGYGLSKLIAQISFHI
jgi:hypothetical protein